MSFYFPELDPIRSHDFDKLIMSYEPPEGPAPSAAALASFTAVVQDTVNTIFSQAIAQAQSPAITSDRANYLSGNTGQPVSYLPYPSSDAVLDTVPICPAPVPVPPLADRITGRDTKEVAFINAFDAATKNHRTISGFDNFLHDLARIISAQDAPASLLPLIATGAYKECYDAYDGWVVKFAVEDNNSDTEQYTYEAALRAGFDALFAETIYFTLPAPLPASEIKGNTDPLVKMILQRAAAPVFVSTPAKGVPYQGHPLTDEWLGELQIGSIPWAEDVILTYGESCLEAFARFILEYYLCDMHAGNLGYIDGRPVVFDWMSDPRDPLDTAPRLESKIFL